MRKMKIRIKRIKNGFVIDNEVSIIEHSQRKKDKERQRERKKKKVKET